MYKDIHQNNAWLKIYFTSFVKNIHQHICPFHFSNPISSNFGDDYWTHTQSVIYRWKLSSKVLCVINEWIKMYPKYKQKLHLQNQPIAINKHVQLPKRSAFTISMYVGFFDSIPHISFLKVHASIWGLTLQSYNLYWEPCYGLIYIAWDGVLMGLLAPIISPKKLPRVSDWFKFEKGITPKFDNNSKLSPRLVFIVLFKTASYKPRRSG